MICVPLKKKTLPSLLSNIKEANKIADVIEIWFDEIPNLNGEKLKEIFKAAKKPIMYKHTGNKEMLERLLQENISYIDLDLKESVNLIKRVKKESPKAELIISFHDFEQTPNIKELTAISSRMLKLGADIIKIAVMANSFSDSTRILSFLSKITQSGQKAICLCMGKEGKITRITGHLLGNYLMYAAINKRDKTAPGQILATELKAIQNQI